MTDNYATCKTQEVGDRLAANPWIRILFTPAYVAWMNLVEVWFGIIERQVLHRRAFRNVRELRSKIQDLIGGRNSRVKPSSGRKSPTKSCRKSTAKEFRNAAGH